MSSVTSGRCFVLNQISGGSTALTIGANTTNAVMVQQT